MLYVAVIPAPLWAIILAGLLMWLTLAYWRRRGVPYAPVFYLLALVQSAVAFAALLLTARNSISGVACMTGIMGAQASMVVALALLGTVFAFLIGARQALLNIMRSNTALFTGFALLQIVVVLIPLRSALLCTV